MLFRNMDKRRDMFFLLQYACWKVCLFVHFIFNSKFRNIGILYFEIAFNCHFVLVIWRKEKIIPNLPGSMQREEREIRSCGYLILKCRLLLRFHSRIFFNYKGNFLLFFTQSLNFATLFILSPPLSRWNYEFALDF